jgi:hypothetical protein
VLSAILSDHGIDRVSESRAQLIRRVAGLSVIAENMEADLVNGKPVDLAEYATLSSTLVRLVSRLGIDRRSKVVVPHLQDYLESRAEADDE